MNECEIYLPSVCVIGAIPNEICQLTSLKMLYLDGNPGVSCYPNCLSSLMILAVDSSVPFKPICPSFQDAALCGMVSATNVGSVYSEWSCTTDGLTVTNPCIVSDSWDAITCDDRGHVNSIVFSNELTGVFAFLSFVNWDGIYVLGSIPPSLGRLSTLTYINFEGNDFRSSQTLC